MGRFRRVENVPSWRALAVHAWGKPADPTVYGTLEIGCEPALAYVAALRERSGEKVTLTHLVGKAAGVAIREFPEVNGILRFGRLWARDTIDVFFQVAFEGGANLAGAKVDRVDEKSVVDIARELRERVERIRQRKDEPTVKSARQLSKLPPLLRALAMRAGETLSFDLGLDLSRLGIPYDAFGCCMVTNVGMFGLRSGHAPLLPFSRCPMLLTVGEVADAPVVREGRIVPGKVVKIGGTFDHRMMDGVQAARLAKRFCDVMEDPARHLG